MELSGNLTQQELGSAAGWSTVAVFQMFPLTSLTKTGCPDSKSMWAPVEVLLGCLLSNSSRILEVSMFLPILDGSCGSVEHGLLPVNISNGHGRLELMGVVLYCNRPYFHGFPSFTDFSITFLAIPTKASANPLLCG